MPNDPATVTTFHTLDEAESALDWIGLEFVEGGDDAVGWFEGELDDDDVELLEDAYATDDTPQPVRALAAALREQVRDPAAARRWRVTFPA